MRVGQRTARTASLAAGSYFCALFAAKNSGKGDATGATFTAVLPDRLTPEYAAFEFGDCTIAKMTVPCTSSRPITSSLAQTVQISFTAPLAPGAFVENKGRASAGVVFSAELPVGTTLWVLLPSFAPRAVEFFPIGASQK